MDKQYVHDILEEFKKNTGIKAKWVPAKPATTDNGIDGHVQFKTTSHQLTIPTQIKANILPVHLAALVNQSKINGTLLVLAKQILPKTKLELQNLEINYIEATGNAYIKLEPLIIIIDGRKKLTAERDLRTKPFTKAGLKVIFILLVHSEYINKTVREIAKAAAVSLETVHNTILGLKELKFLILLKNNTWQWNNKKMLFERWITDYETRLKPALHIGNFEFLDEKEFLNWKKINLKNIHTRWGSEAAGEILTGYLKPETLTIYTKEQKADCIKNYKLLPNPQGYIKIYQNFWLNDEIGKNTVPAELVYADLINTGNRRSIETAQKIYEQYLQSKF
jgi:hypothetical protein